MKRAILLIPAFLLILALSSCNKEEPLEVSAKFTTNIQNGTLTAKQSFTIYTGETTGEFLTYFKGGKVETTYGTGFGIAIEPGIDSVLMTPYGWAVQESPDTTYTLTLVATSYGNWGETVAQDVQSIDIKVVPEPEVK
jgi:hypothetical protein